GDIAPGTRFALPDGGSVLLAEDVTASAARTVTGLHLVDASGLGADVAAGVVTTAAVEVDPSGGSASGTDPGTTPAPGTSSGGAAVAGT
ncbi:hypothetical protein DZF97_18545, partial [Clavibacter nebraskensis]